MLHPQYVVGLIDGAGIFTVYVKDSVSRSAKGIPRVEPRFYVKMVEKDKQILEDLKDFFGCGNIYSQKDSRDNRQNCYRFEVTSRRQLEERIIPFFTRHPLHIESKRKAFSLFSELVRRVKQEEHLTLAGIKTLQVIKDQIC